MLYVISTVVTFLYTEDKRGQKNTQEG